MTQQQYRVYLAVPGRNFCWGTVTGVVNSTVKHVAIPHNAGYGFSGVEDFNLLWTDAHNFAEAGDATHFAMLHGDITPDVTQRWLDILLDEMDRLDASLVSAVSPIKDPRGVTSSGICDLDDPWKPFRRFTIREIEQSLPETFNNVDAGYPDRPLLHNTGCWVCDLRKPEFHAKKPDGSLDLYFEFPTAAFRSNGKWEHRRESEDWHFSRSLWARGVRNTYITRKVRLRHHGDSVWTNFGGWGQFQDGDENTAEKWRPKLEAKPLRMLQMLQFELGEKCNLASQHTRCPNLRPERFARLDTFEELDDETIVACAVAAYKDLGFTGFVGWAYYNEPLLQADRMFGLMARIKSQVPQARFLLWTNGTLIPEDCEPYRQFAQIILSCYTDSSQQGLERLRAKSIPVSAIDDPQLDGRLDKGEPADATAPCLRPFVEFVIDAYGNTHICCYDWRGEGALGNVFAVPFAELAERWRHQIVPTVAGREMNEAAPRACRDCGHRWDKYQQHDPGIVDRARRWRDALPALDPAENAEPVVA
jgi:hypothetical protein